MASASQIRPGYGGHSGVLLGALIGCRSAASSSGLGSGTRALGVAAPVRGADGRVLAALSVVVPNDAGAQAVVPVLRTAARGASRALGALTGREGACCVTAV
ncbi:hypothetical protein [Streptomyces sp. NPDC001604]|uniref:hypothetical protein n=1 Tax=Streptomyces sp. NPDC001604 TaxID=3364593 RepID=UPI0036AD1E03